jgi:hypothetical protein
LVRHAPRSRAAVFLLPRAATWYQLCEAKQAIDTRLYNLARTEYRTLNPTIRLFVPCNLRILSRERISISQ